MNSVEHIYKKIKEIGPVLPGNLETFYNVCGKAGCRCKDKQNPQKHGPYHRLSYSIAGRNSSMFVKKDDVESVKDMVGNYRKLRELSLQLALANLDSVKQRGIAETMKLSQPFDKNSIATSWKSKCSQKSSQLRAAMIKIRDLTKSRDKWKQECLRLQKKTDTSKTKRLNSESPEGLGVRGEK
jgi:hypothetical protein